MHPLLSPLPHEGTMVTGYAFWCPGCASINSAHGLHVFIVRDADGNSDQEWTFDGDSSFEPSLAYESAPECHLHLTDGQIRYYPDCEHFLAGQIVEMVPIPNGEHEERG